jgi:hypothetical protein
MKSRTATAVALVLAAIAGAAQAQDKKVIQSASDIPPLVIELPKKPSELVLEGGAELDAIKDKVEAHAEHLLRDYDIRDAATAKQVRSVLAQVAMAENRWADVLRLNEEVKALEEKAAAKAMIGLISGSYARAALAVGEDEPAVQAQVQGRAREGCRRPRLGRGPRIRCRRLASVSAAEPGRADRIR